MKNLIFKKIKPLLFVLPLALCSACGSARIEKPVISDYRSDYSPVFESKLPVISIASESKNNDFVTQPLSEAVKQQMLHWMDNVPNPSPWYENCSVSVTDGEGKAFIENTSAKVKVRGNWTTTYDKKPLRIKFDKKQAMLGLNGGKEFKDWVLLALYKDWSLLRDASALYLSKMISPDYSSDFRLVEVYVNSQYWGVYLLAEQQQVKKGRLPVNEAEKNYKATDIGYFMEFDGYYFSEENNFEIDYTGPISDINGEPISFGLNKGYTIKSDIYSSEQKAFISSYMNNLWKICYEASYNNKYYEFNEDFTDIIESKSLTNAYDCISKVIDINSLVNSYMIAEITCDPDLFWSSFYMDVDFSASGAKKLKFEAPWDFDSSLGNKNFCADGKGVYAGALSWDVNHQKRGTGNPWMMIFINCDWFQSLLRQKWAMIKKQDMHGKLIDFIDKSQSLYAQSFEQNSKRWQNIGPEKPGAFELCKEAVECKSQADSCAYLKKWINSRFDGLDEVWK